MYIYTEQYGLGFDGEVSFRFIHFSLGLIINLLSASERFTYKIDKFIAYIYSIISTDSQNV